MEMSLRIPFALVAITNLINDDSTANYMTKKLAGDNNVNFSVTQEMVL